MIHSHSQGANTLIQKIVWKALFIALYMRLTTNKINQLV
jgi:hypothetical protein